MRWLCFDCKSLTSLVKGTLSILLFSQSMQNTNFQHHGGHLKGQNKGMFLMEYQKWQKLRWKSRHKLTSSSKDSWKILECLSSVPLLFPLSTCCASKWNKTNNKTHFWFHTFCPAMHSFTLTTPNILPTSTSQTCCISHNDSNRFQNGWLFHRL